MRKSKKLLSLLLTICMLLSAVAIISLPASAEGEEFYYVYDSSSNALTFYYDANRESLGGTACPTAATTKKEWGYDSIRTDVKSVVIDESVENYTGLTSTAYMFNYMWYANSISGCEYLDVSNVINMEYMFTKFGLYSTSLNVVPNVKYWDTSKVTNMQSMFSQYGAANTSFNIVPDVSNWDTSSVTNMSSMFLAYARSSTVITVVPDVSRWNTSNVTNMDFMFNEYAYNSGSITAVPNVSRWNTSNVTNMCEMFENYAYSVEKTLQPLNLSKWDISSLNAVNNMFNCYNHNNPNYDTIVYATDWSDDNKNIEEFWLLFDGSKLKEMEDGWSAANTSDEGRFTALNIPEAVENATYSASLTLKDNIDVNFSMNNLGTNFEASKLSFKVNNTELATSDTFTYDNTKNIASGMSVSVAPEDMDDTLNIAITYDGTVIEEFNYSVRAYCNAVFKKQKVAKANDASDVTYDKLAELCTAVLNYGKYAEDYANRDTADYTASALNSGHIIDFTKVDVDILKDTSSSATDAGASLTLGSTISMNFYVKDVGKDLTEKDTDGETYKNFQILNNLGQKVNDKYITVESYTTDGYSYKITISNIYAEQMSRAYTLKVDGEALIAYGVYNYCSDAQTAFADDTTLTTLCKAIYNYGAKAAAFTA